MKTQYQNGDAIDVTLSATQNPGDGLEIGSLIGVLANGGVSGAADALWLEGVFSVKKNSAEAWTVGELIYWDNVAKQFTATATSNTKAGVAVLAAANPSATGTLRLNGTFGV